MELVCITAGLLSAILNQLSLQELYRITCSCLFWNARCKMVHNATLRISEYDFYSVNEKMLWNCISEIFMDTFEKIWLVNNHSIYPHNTLHECSFFLFFFISSFSQKFLSCIKYSYLRVTFLFYLDSP